MEKSTCPFQTEQVSVLRRGPSPGWFGPWNNTQVPLIAAVAVAPWIWAPVPETMLANTSPETTCTCLRVTSLMINSLRAPIRTRLPSGKRISQADRFCVPTRLPGGRTSPTLLHRVGPFGPARW